MKIVLVNAKYSANLGDGVIAECLEFGLRQRLPEINILNCDLTGRTAFGDSPEILRVLARNLLPITPDAIKKSVYNKLFVAMVRGRLLPHYDRSVNGANLAIVGGGQLLTDADLNFPVKLAAAASIIRDRNLPIAIHAVGVGADWSAEGAELFDEAFAGSDIFWASARDELSKKRWRRHFGSVDVPTPRVCMDPSMLAGKVFAPGERNSAPRRNRPLIGLCVTHPSNLLSQSDVGGAEHIAPDVEFYRGCIDALAADECDILLFTNGARDDEAYLRRCAPHAFLSKFSENQVLVAEQSKTPAELVATIRRCDAVAAHRLHACIIAYAFKIPHVGLSMNTKLDALFDMVGRRDFLLGPNNVDPGSLAAAVRRAFETPISENAHALIVNRVERDFDELAAELVKFGRPKQAQIASR